MYVMCNEVKREWSRWPGLKVSEWVSGLCEWVNESSYNQICCSSAFTLITCIWEKQDYLDLYLQAPLYTGGIGANGRNPLFQYARKKFRPITSNRLNSICIQTTRWDAPALDDNCGMTEIRIVYFQEWRRPYLPHILRGLDWSHRFFE